MTTTTIITGVKTSPVDECNDSSADISMLVLAQ